MTEAKQDESANGAIAPSGAVSRQTMSVVEAGYQLGVGKNKSYELAKQGVIPTIQLGERLRVPIPAFNRMLGVV